MSKLSLIVKWNEKSNKSSLNCQQKHRKLNTLPLLEWIDLPYNGNPINVDKWSSSVPGICWWTLMYNFIKEQMLNELISYCLSWTFSFPVSLPGLRVGRLTVVTTKASWVINQQIPGDAITRVRNSFCSDANLAASQLLLVTTKRAGMAKLEIPNLTTGKTKWTQYVQLYFSFEKVKNISFPAPPVFKSGVPKMVSSTKEAFVWHFFYKEISSNSVQHSQK